MVRFGLAAVLLGACSFRTNGATGDGAPPRDSTPIDLPVDVMPDGPPPVACTAASASCLDGNTLETCTGPSAQPVVTTCPWGCLTSGTDHCGALAPAGGAVTSSDLAAGGGNLGDVTMGPTVVDTEIGTIAGVTSGYTFTTRNNVGIFRFRSLTIDGPIAFTGKHAVAFVALDAITVNSTIDARGPCALSRITAGPGGFDGGAGDTAASGSGGGGTNAGKNDGGGGGGHGGNGGQGGNNGGAGGATFGDDQISALVGGGGGGGGHNTGHDGGGGGGAIQLVSNTSLVINTGGINAGGCGGTSTSNDGNGGGGGGGAGGTILLEGPTVRISGNLAVNGGAGGGNTTDGGDGSLDRNAATNGDGGGAGGAGATTAGTGASTGGGGGGGVGRIRINTRSGQATITGVLSPDVGTTTTQGTATIN